MDTTIYADPAMPVAPARAARPRRSPLRTLAWLVVLAALGGVVWAGMSAAFAKHDWLYHEGIRLHTPMVVGGYPKMSSSMANQLEWDAKAGAGDYTQAQVGFYGAPGEVPHYMLFAGLGFEQSGRQVLAGLRAGLTGVTAGRITTTASGLSCQTLTIPKEHVRGAACAWAGSRSGGSVLAFAMHDLKKLAAVTAVARTRVESD